MFPSILDPSVIWWRQNQNTGRQTSIINRIMETKPASNTNRKWENFLKKLLVLPAEFKRDNISRTYIFCQIQQKILSPSFKQVGQLWTSLSCRDGLKKEFHFFFSTVIVRSLHLAMYILAPCSSASFVLSSFGIGKYKPAQVIFLMTSAPQVSSAF